jgi:hypothetical protein
MFEGLETLFLCTAIAGVVGVPGTESARLSAETLFAWEPSSFVKPPHSRIKKTISCESPPPSYLGCGIEAIVKGWFPSEEIPGTEM